MVDALREKDGKWSGSRCLMFGVFAVVACLYLWLFAAQMFSDFPSAKGAFLDRALTFEQQRFDNLHEIVNGLVNFALVAILPYGANAIGKAINGRAAK